MEVTKALAQEVCDISQTISEGQDGLVREILERVSNKWSLWILYVLAKSGAPVRFSDIVEQVDGISNKMLVKTLRLLERDGLIVRYTQKRQVPPKVEYELNSLGRKLLQTTTPLWKWVVSSVEQFEQARIRFDPKS